MRIFERMVLKSAALLSLTMQHNGLHSPPEWIMECMASPLSAWFLLLGGCCRLDAFLKLDTAPFKSRVSTFFTTTLKKRRRRRRRAF